MLLSSIWVGTVLLVAGNLADAENLRQRLFQDIQDSCDDDEFPCLDGGCVSKSQFCNGHHDCGDNSDENYCNTYNCPGSQFLNCAGGSYGNLRCIPLQWRCDGVKDCTNGADEVACKEVVKVFATSDIWKSKRRADKWILKQRKSGRTTQKWGPDVSRIAIALYFGNKTTTLQDPVLRSEVAYELSISLLSRLALKKIEDVTSTELASYINAFLVTCIDPRKFYVVDLVGELRYRVDAKNYTNPFTILTLCNAGDRITERDVEMLIQVFWKAHREFWTDTQALVLMALSCAASQPHEVVDQADLNELATELKKRQYRNGTVENLKTTALVMQALFASQREADEDNFDEEKAIKQLIQSQAEDGSIGGSVVNTYYALPVLGYRSLLNISSAHCGTYPKDEKEGLQNLLNQVGAKWNIGYSLWIGDNRTVERDISLSVPANISVYGLMEFAADIDAQFRFEYSMRNGKPYVYSISGIQDDPENEMFWFPHWTSDGVEEELTPITQSPADVIPKDKQHLVYWYKCGGWTK